ncbi:MAG: sigma 54-interacting transcriptional regulator [Woeseiaceae bacterium]|nr:sigma 54-interacting transcriptional regulator [Woeseiaceae bacterium]
MAKPKNQKNGEQERQSELEAWHALILESAGEGIHGLDANGRVTFGNAAAERILGWKLKDILGQKSHDLHHHSYPDGSIYPRENCPIYAALTDGKVHHVEDEVFWHTDGSAVPVEYTSTPIIKDGKPDGAVVVFRDISERKAAITKLEKLTNTYQAILDSAGEGIYGLDREGRITFGNRAAEGILGWQSGEVLGKKGHVVHHHSYADGSPYPHEACPIYAALKDGEVHRVDDEVFWRNDGSPVPVEYSSTPIVEDGEPVGAVVVFRDISERKKLEAQQQSSFEQIKELKEQLELERDYLRDEVNVALHYGEIVGESQALKRTLAQVSAVASTPANVLILGESGVGKELIARAIHAQSDRSEKPLVKVNCASIPKDLFESEFFGHVKGSFTGAQRDRVGRLQLADGGTLFLDEVGEIPLSQQGKLLRALQEQEFERVGDDKTTKVDVRVVAATNRDLSEEIKAGRFREDLYYRLSVFPIDVPPLRDRVADIAPLARHFLKLIAAELGREHLRISQQQHSLLERHQWPGNIRELKNVIERAAISSTGNKLRIDLALADATPNTAAAPHEPISDEVDFVTDAEFRLLEKANVTAALQYADWRIWGDGGAADLLGLNPSTLKYRMKQLEIRKETAR